SGYTAADAAHDCVTFVVRHSAPVLLTGGVHAMWKLLLACCTRWAQGRRFGRGCADCTVCTRGPLASRLAPPEQGPSAPGLPWPSVNRQARIANLHQVHPGQLQHLARRDERLR